jgi:hypothetical protein
MPARCLARFLVALLVPASTLAAEDPPRGDEPRPWRLLVGPSLTAATFATTYSSRYAPPFESVPHTSTATQTLPLDSGRGPGAWLGVQRTLASHVGLLLSTHYGTADLSGVPGRYDLRMRYTSRPPPSHEPVETTVMRSEAQPAAEGEMKTLAVALDVLAWADLGSRARLGFGAGPVWLRVKGRAQSLVYTEFFMGGHSTAFSEDYRGALEFPASTFGLDVGGFAEVDLGRRAGLRLDVRYCWGPEQAAEVTVAEVVNAESTIRSKLPDEVQDGLAPGPVVLDPSFFRASVALALRF